MSGVQGEHPICSALMARARRISSADTEILDFAFFLELLEFAPGFFNRDAGAAGLPGMGVM